jgi:hypothetical protein
VVRGSVERSSCQMPRQRVVLLGASNLTRGISTVVETAQDIFGQRLEVLTALGHGRSYGIESRMLGRCLPGIIDCALWEVLAGASCTPTTALVTDVGNDILYGVEVPQIVAWVAAAIDRLQSADARVCMTLLPVISIERLGTARFLFFRQLLFPRCRLSLSEVCRRAVDLHDELLRLGRSRDVRLIEHDALWYGFDPIHIRQRHWRSAWPQILAAWDDDVRTERASPRGSLMRWLYLRTRCPHQRRVFGIDQRRAQPSARLRDGTTIAFY